jgi:hypothetical protein
MKAGMMLAMSPPGRVFADVHWGWVLGAGAALAYARVMTYRLMKRKAGPLWFTSLLAFVLLVGVVMWHPSSVMVQVVCAWIVGDVAGDTVMKLWSRLERTATKA